MNGAVRGDVIQIDPAHDPGGFGGCLAVVEESKEWGVSLCYVHIPGEDGGDAYYRLPHGTYVVIGKAEWVHAEGKP